MLNEKGLIENVVVNGLLGKIYHHVLQRVKREKMAAHPLQREGGNFILGNKQITVKLNNFVSLPGKKEKVK